MPAWMNTTWDDHRYAPTAPSRRARFFFQCLDSFCALLRWVRS